MRHATDHLPHAPKVLIVGGPDVHARIDLMHGLADRFTLAAAGTAPELAAPFAKAGFPYFDYPLGRTVGPCGDVRAAAALWRIIARYRPHIVHAFDTKPGVYACLAARLAGVRVVIGTITGLGSLYGAAGMATRLVRGVYEWLQRLTSRAADLTIFQNRDDRAEFLARHIVPAAKSALIAGSGVPTDIIDPRRVSASERVAVRAGLGIPPDAPLVTMVARVIRSKGVEEFIAAARQVRATRPAAHFLLVGPADRASVDRFSAAELVDLARIVHWPGARSDIPQVLAASDLFVLPSYLREGIPRALLEAAAMGLPLVTTDTPGCNDVVDDGVNGHLVPPRDSAALAGAIERLLDRPGQCREFGRRSRERAVECFDLGVVVAATRAHYTKLLARKTTLSAPRMSASGHRDRALTLAAPTGGTA